MDERMRVEAETTARFLLQRFGEEHQAWSDDKTPVDALASWLGFRVATFHPSDHPDGTYGYVDDDQDEHLIWLNSSLKDMFRRFTLAHELGHVLLHFQHKGHIETIRNEIAALLPMRYTLYSTADLSQDDLCYKNDIQEATTGLLDQEQYQEMLGIGMSHDPRSQREVAANLFAAELLMPIERIRALYLEHRVPPTTLADRFAVSHTAMLNRLASLLKPPSVAGITFMASTNSSPAVNVVPTMPGKKYDEFQQRAIAAATPALITAGPGSGKTSTLIGRIEYMVDTLAIPPAHILALTFSRKAAQEMEERLQTALQGETLPKVSTFHAFCADLLRQHGDLVGLRPDFTLLDEAEGYFVLQQLANKLRLRHYQNLHNPALYFPEFLKAISRAKDELVDPEHYMQLAQQMLAEAVLTQDSEATEKAEKVREVAHVYQLYENALQQRGDTDFGGLLVLAIRLLRQEPEVLQEQQEQYQHILVDEFQDMNRASGVLLRELAGVARKVWVVGDANQAIYGFRGASPANIGNFSQDFPGATILPLSRNYRSRPDLVAIAESFRFKQLELGEEATKNRNESVRLTQDDAYVTLAKASNEACELTGLVQDIRAKYNGGYAYKDIVVLCRTRSVAQKVSQALIQAGLPVIERSGLLEQEHIKDVLSILLLLIDDSGMGLLRATRLQQTTLSPAECEQFLLAAHQQGLAPRQLLERLSRPYVHMEGLATLSSDGIQALLDLKEILHNLERAPTIWTLLTQYLLLETSRVRTIVVGVESKQRTALLAEYDALLQLARQYDQQQQTRLQRITEVVVQDGEDVLPVAPEQEQKRSQAERIKGFLEYVSLLITLRQDSNRQGADTASEEQTDVIRVMTVHASKGLEFPVVYLPSLVQRRFPAQQRSHPVPTPVGMLPAESEGSQAHESGESCLFYVGVTRARDHLILSHSERYGKISYKHSPYLDALEAGLSEERLIKLRWETEGESEQIAEVGIDDGPSALFIEAMKEKKLDVSTIEEYQHCPRQYAYHFIYHFANDKSAYQRFWQATQRTVEDLRKHYQDVPDPISVHDEAKEEQNEERIRLLYSEHWRELGGHEVPFAEMYEQHGHEIAALVQEALSSNDEVTWDMRPAYKVEVAGHTIHLNVDRVDTPKEAGAPTKFVRTRFGKRKEPPVPETRELLYAHAYRQYHPGQSVELHTHNLSTGEMHPIVLNPRKEKNLYNDLEQALQGLERNEYPIQPKEPGRCPTCPFFFICPV